MCLRAESNIVQIPFVMDVYKVVRLSGGQFKSLFAPEDRGRLNPADDPGPDITYIPGVPLVAPSVEQGYYVYISQRDAFEALRYWNSRDKTTALLSCTLVSRTSVVYGLDTHIGTPKAVLKVKDLYVGKEISQASDGRTGSIALAAVGVDPK